jgi:hypothetical protein
VLKAMGIAPAFMIDKSAAEIRALTDLGIPRKDPLSHSVRLQGAQRIIAEQLMEKVAENLFSCTQLASPTLQRVQQSVLTAFCSCKDWQ